MKRSLLVGLGMALLAGTLSCVGIDDIDRTQANALHKDTLRNSAWYYRQTIVDVPPTDASNVVGYPSSLEKIRWDIQEKVLIAYRTYEKVPGADSRVDRNQTYVNGTFWAPNQPGAGEAPEQYKENPIAAFPILAHFDIKRDFNPATGEQTNVLTENTVDRPWQDRSYMRVNWSVNMISNFEFFSKTLEVTSDQNFYVQPHECDPSSFDTAKGDFRRDSEGRCLVPHEDAFRFECSSVDGRLDPRQSRLCRTDELLAGNARPVYFDFTTKYHVRPSIGGCFFGRGLIDCTDSEVKVRNSFMRVTDRDFEAKHYDDLMLAKFGYFRTERLSYDRREGVTESGRIRLANVHNIWKGTFTCAQGTPDTESGLCAPISDAAQIQSLIGSGAYPEKCFAKTTEGQIDTNRLPYGGGYALDENCGRIARPHIERQLRPITYFVSPHYPTEMLPSAFRIGAEFNRAFRRAVVAAWGYGDHVPDDMPLNDLTSDGKVYRSRVVKGMDCIPTAQGAQVPGECSGTAVPAELAVPDMFVICNNPVAEGDNAACGAPGTYARNGDIRYNFLYWVRQPQVAGPLGLGPSSPDPETGEIINAMAYLYGAGVDRAAADGADIVELLNGERSIDDILNATNIKQFVETNLYGTNDNQLNIPATLTRMPIQQLSSALVGEKGMARLAALDQTNGPKPVAADYAEQRLAAIRGTDIERMLINDEIVAALAPQALNPGVSNNGFGLGADQTPDLSDLSPASWGHARKLLREDERNYLSNTLTGCVFKADFADDSIYGVARRLKDEADANGLGGIDRYNFVFQRLREFVFEGVGAHEVGHSVGLRHNFQGSYDSLNYHAQYWQLRLNSLKNLAPTSTTAEMLEQANQTEEQRLGGMREYQYSALMDYNSPTISSEVHGIGKYEDAAILFGYTGYVEAFKNPGNGLREVMNWRLSNRIRGFFQANANSAGRLYFTNKTSVLFDGLPQAWHYTQLPYLAGDGAVNCTDGRTNRPKTSGCDPNIDSGFFVEGGDPVQGVQNMLSRRLVKWSDIKPLQEDPSQAQDPNSIPIEVPYLFCSDEWVGNTASCHRWDQGADRLEQINRYIDTYYRYYIFNNFARDRYGFTADGWLARVYQRYFSLVPNFYQNWVFNDRFVSSAIAYNNNTAGMVAGFNWLHQVMTTPRYGSYRLVDGMYRHQNYEFGQDMDLEIKMGDGRRGFSRYDYNSGYNVYSRVLEVGHFWDYLGALFALTDSTASRLGSEIASDFTSFLLPFNLVFADQMNLLSNSIVMNDCRTCSLAEGGQVTPYQALALEQGPAPTGTPVSPEINFTQRLFVLLYSMAFYNSAYDLTWHDQAHIFRIGNGEQITPSVEDGFEVMTCSDPQTGDQYGAVIRTGAPATSDSLAAGMVRRCIDLATRYEAATGQERTDLGFQLSEHVKDLNIMRSMYSLFGRVN